VFLLLCNKLLDFRASGQSIIPAHRICTHDVAICALMIQHNALHTLTFAWSIPSANPRTSGPRPSSLLLFWVMKLILGFAYIFLCTHHTLFKKRHKYIDLGSALFESFAPRSIISFPLSVVSFFADQWNEQWRGAWWWGWPSTLSSSQPRSLYDWIQGGEDP